MSTFTTDDHRHEILVPIVTDTATPELIRVPAQRIRTILRLRDRQPFKDKRFDLAVIYEAGFPVVLRRGFAVLESLLGSMGWCCEDDLNAPVADLFLGLPFAAERGGVEPVVRRQDVVIENDPGKVIWWNEEYAAAAQAQIVLAPPPPPPEPAMAPPPVEPAATHPVEVKPTPPIRVRRLPVVEPVTQPEPTPTPPIRVRRPIPPPPPAPVPAERSKRNIGKAAFCTKRVSELTGLRRVRQCNLTEKHLADYRAALMKATTPEQALAAYRLANTRHISVAA